MRRHQPVPHSSVSAREDGGGQESHKRGEKHPHNQHFLFCFGFFFTALMIQRVNELEPVDVAQAVIGAMRQDCNQNTG